MEDKKNWILSIILGLLFLIGFALPNSDKATISTLFFSLTALVALIFWSLEIDSFPEIKERPELSFLAIAIFILFMVVAFPVVISFINKSEAAGGGVLDVSAGFLEISKSLGIICALFLGIRLGTNKSLYDKSFDIITFIVAIWALASIIMFIQDPSGVYGQAKFGTGRLTGAFSSPNSAGTLFGAFCASSFTRLINRWVRNPLIRLSKRISILNFVTLALCASALFLTQSRGAAIATIASIIIAALFILAKEKGKAFLPVLITLMIVILIPLFMGWNEKVIDRFSQFSMDYASRKAIFEVHFAQFKNHMWLGNGIGSFITLNNAYINQNNYTLLTDLNTAHNAYIQWLEETGIIGFTCLILVNLIVVLRLIIIYFTRANVNSRIVAALAIYLVLIIHSFSDYATQEPIIAAFFATIMGMAFAMSGTRRQTKQAKATKIGIIIDNS